MRLPAAALAVFSLAAPAEAQTGPVPPRVAPPIVHEVTPALGTYTDAVLFGDVWRRPDLSPRDRSVVTIAALIAGGHTGQMTGHFNRGLDNGVTGGEIAAIITHLAFYAGWPRAISAVAVAKEVFAQRGVGPDPAASAAPLPVDAAQEAQRAAAVEGQAGAVAPALVQYTNGVLFGDLWRRADLAPRDRSLVTIAALIAAGQVEQLPFHMHRGMDAGLTRVQLSEAITHLAFYAGWPRAIATVPVAKAVFEARAGSPPAAPVEVLRRGAQPSAKGRPSSSPARCRSTSASSDPPRRGSAAAS